MKPKSAGILVFRIDENTRTLMVLIAHPGGPFWARKDDGAWSIVKGEFDPDEEPSVAAEREFLEETGLSVPVGERISLGEVRQSGGKTVVAWAVRGDLDLSKFHSNTFEMIWPPKSNKVVAFPEVDRLEWFSLNDARQKLLKSQLLFLDRLVEWWENESR